MVLCCARNRLFKIRLRLGVATVLRKPHAHCKIGLRIVGVDFKCAFVVRHGIENSVLELVEAQSHLVGKFGGRVFLRWLRVLHFWRQFYITLRRNWSIREKHLARSICYRRRVALVSNPLLCGNRLAPRRVRIDGYTLLGKDRLAILEESDRAILQYARRVETDEHLVICETVNIYRTVDRHVLDAADPLHWKPELLDLARLVRRDPRVVRLVVRPAADHQFEVGSVVVRENLVPHVRLGEVAPEEEFLADRDVAVRDMRRSALLLVIVAGHERVVGIHSEN